MRVAIPLTNGGVTWVSPEDAELVSHYSWCRSAQGYARSTGPIGAARSALSLHRFLLNPPAGLVVDHLNAVRMDNQRHNLEVITAEENIRRAAERRLWFRLWAASADAKGQLNLFPNVPVKTGRKLGEDHRGSKLKTWQAAVIKYSAIPVGECAQQFSVSYGTAMAIRGGRAWKHVSRADLLRVEMFTADRRVADAARAA